MTQKELDSLRKREGWRRILADFKASGQSTHAYCRDKHIPQSTFRYWQKTLMKETMTDAAMLGVMNVPADTPGVEEVVQVAEHAISRSVEDVQMVAPAETKNIDTQRELSVDGVVFDMEHNRLYVPGNATEQTIGVAINILRGLIPQPAVAAPVLT